MKSYKKLVAILLMLVFAFSFVLFGCSKAEQPGADKPKADASGDVGDTQDKDSGQKPEIKELDLSLFTGGYTDLWSDTVELYKEKFPGVEIKSDLDPKNHERLRARLVAGNPPDVTLTVQANFDLFGAIASGQYRNLNDVFEESVPGTNKKYKDLMPENLLKLVTIDGDIYLAPSDSYYGGVYYNKNMFEENGWEEPENWQEFIDLCAKIKAKGIAPFTYQGIYPSYMIWGFLAPAIAATGGYDTYIDVMNLEPDAWHQDAVMEAVSRLKTMVDKGYILEGTTALDHTQSQMEFLNGRVAFIPNGTWFETEMADSVPDGFGFGFMPIPMADKDGTMYLTSLMNYFGIPAEAKNVEAAKEWIKMIYSDEAVKLQAEHGITPVRTGIKDEVLDMYPKSVKNSLEVISRPNIAFTDNMGESFYPTLYKSIGDNITLLVLGEIDVQQFCDNVEKEAERIRNDDSVVKYQR